MERPQTLGARVLSLGVTGQYFEVDEFDGEKVGTDPNPILLGGDAIRFQARPKIIYHVATVQATYGILDDLDLNLAIPIADIDADLNATRQAAGGGPLFINTQHGHVSIGVMDMLLRAKYQLERFVGFPAAAGLVARLPSGDADKLLGTGNAELGPYVYLSTLLWGRVEPHFNTGFNVNLTDTERSSVQYAAGFDVQAIKEWLDLGAAFLGRSEVARPAAQSSISGPHLTPSGPGVSPYAGLDLSRKDFLDFSGGARIRLYRTLVASLTINKSLNDDGARSSEWSPIGGFEATF